MVSEWRGRWLRALRDLRGLRRFSEMSARRCRGRATLVTMSFRGRVRMSTFSACSADYRSLLVRHCVSRSDQPMRAQWQGR
jgi:hypothetical protein